MQVNARTEHASKLKFHVRSSKFQVDLEQQLDAPGNLRLPITDTTSQSELLVKAVVKKERHAAYPLVVIFVLLVAGIITDGCLYYRNYEQQFRAEAEHELSAIAELKVDELAQYRRERLEDAAMFFNNAAFSGLVRRFFDHPEDVDAQRQIQEWTGKLMATDQYDLVRLLDAQGVTRLSSPAGVPPVSSVVLQRIPEILRLGQVAFQDFHRNEHDQRVYLDILIPILDEQDASRPLGVFYLRIDPEKYFYPFIQRWPVPSRTAETLLVRQDGNDALFLNELKFQTNTALNLRIPLENTNVAAVKAVLGQKGIVEGRDYRGEPVLAALLAVPDSPWFLVARMDTAEVFAPMRARFWQVVVMICVLLFGSGACVGLVWRQQRVRFYQAKYEAEEARTKLSAIVESSEDAIVSESLDGIITNWNASAERIYGYSAAEAIGKPITILIPPEHPNEFPQFTGKIKRGEAIKHFETDRIRKNGERIQMSLSLSPVKDEAGAIVGISVIGRDITERKRTEEKLRQLSRAVEQSPASIVITNPAGDIEYVNPKFIEVTGYTLAEALGKNPRILKSGEKGPEAYRELWQTITAGKEWNGEFLNKKKNGELYWESASISPIRDLAGRITHYVAVKEDITARKQTEAERDMLIHDLQDALANVKSLSGLLPICAGCKKIRDDKGYWSQVESYIQKHSEATFTHGLCPDCLKKLYPDVVEGGLGNSPGKTPQP
jgi:PAS domain S-box-containing protein